MIESIYMATNAFILLLLLFPFSAYGQANSIVINEIAWMGSPVEGVDAKQWWRYEWVELYNNTDAVVVLDGWTLELYRDKLDFTISLAGTIIANGYYVAGASEKIPNLDLNYKNLGGKFFNGGQRVILKNSLGEIIDEVNAFSGWSAGDNKTKQTMERVVGSDPTTLWQTSKDSGGTPKSPNSEGVKLSLAKDEVKLSEAKDGTEKDLAGSSSSPQFQSFQSHVPIVNPITLLAGLLALGFSGVLLLVKRSLALRQSSGQASRQKNRRA